MPDLVEYQTGSVVSRTLVKRPTGTVTLFAFVTQFKMLLTLIRS
jgi:hypothetical protein